MLSGAAKRVSLPSEALNSQYINRSVSLKLTELLTQLGGEF